MRENHLAVLGSLVARQGVDSTIGTGNTLL